MVGLTVIPARLLKFILLAASILLAAPSLAQSKSSPSSRASSGLHALLTAPEVQVIDARYVGPGSCSAVACHGGIAPRMSTKVLQNEYSTWVTEDQHARAFTVLTQPVARQMTYILKIGPAERAPKCLICHALSVEPAHRAREFDISEGVSCESCHGPASNWLGPHIQAGAKHAEMVRLGLIDNKNLATRSEVCLSCHLGAKGMEVDHEMIAAGHPDLTFELDSFTAVEPPHWIEKDPDPLFGMRAWSIGQAVQVRESMLRVARRARSGPWPEFSEMDCITCHHSLTGPQSWRQQEGYPDRRAGDPPYNVARLIVFRHFAEEIDANTSRELTAEVDMVSRLITTMSPDRVAVEAAADRAAVHAAKLLAEVRVAQYDRARTQHLLRAIVDDADGISRQGERSAEQAAMTIDSLYIASAKAGASNPETRVAIDGLFLQVKNPSAYNAPQFAAQMRRVAATLH
jgi:Cytochrome c554 and c-prime